MSAKKIADFIFENTGRGVNYAMRKRWSYENIIDEIAELNHTKTLNPCIIFVPVGEVKYNLKYLTHYLLHNIPTS